MEDFLKAFKNKSTIVESKTVNAISVQPEFSGVTRVSKGNLSADHDWYARTYTVSMGGKKTYVVLDDYDIHNVRNVMFNGVIVDDLNKLIKSLQDSGLKTLADSLEVSNKEIVIHISKSLQNDKFFKYLYGDDAVITNSFTDDELLFIKLEESIANYDNLAINTWYSVPFLNDIPKDLIVNGVTKALPTMLELLEKRDKLDK